MIRRFEVKNPEDTHVSWWADVPALAKPRAFDFAPGLNVLWGRNGSGKSTLLTAMARLLHCRQGGVPVLTETSIRELFDRSAARVDDADVIKRMNAAIVLDHDGQGVRYCDPTAAVGLSGGGFDWDFGMQGIVNARLRASAGQTTSVRLNSIIEAVLQRQAAPEIMRKIDADRVNDLWGKRIGLAEKFLRGSGTAGPATILLDEPDRSLDMPTQRRLWSLLRAAAREHQIIVASHTVFALSLSDANYIEMDPGYLAECNIVASTNSMDDYRKSEPLLLPKPKPAEKKTRTRKSKEADRPRARRQP